MIAELVVERRREDEYRGNKTKIWKWREDIYFFFGRNCRMRSRKKKAGR
jgi:hypothetical protein